MDYMRLLCSVCVCLFSLLELTVADEPLGRGFNNNIKWMNMEDGRRAALEHNKPMMILIHKSWCGACKQLKPQFNDDKQIEELSSKFVMVNIQDAEDEDLGEGYAPQGAKYIPRILFTGPDGIVREEHYNVQGNPQYKYYYSDPPQIVNAMEEALNKIVTHDTAQDEL